MSQSKTPAVGTPAVGTPAVAASNLTDFNLEQFRNLRNLVPFLPHVDHSPYSRMHVMSGSKWAQDAIALLLSQLKGFASIVGNGVRFPITTPGMYVGIPNETGPLLKAWWSREYVQTSPSVDVVLDAFLHDSTMPYGTFAVRNLLRRIADMCNCARDPTLNSLWAQEASKWTRSLMDLQKRKHHPVMDMVASMDVLHSAAAHLSALLINLVPVLVSSGDMEAADVFVADVCFTAFALYGGSVLGCATHGSPMLAQQLLSYATMRVTRVLHEEQGTGVIGPRRLAAMVCVIGVLQAVGALVRSVALPLENIHAYIAIEGSIEDLKQKVKAWVPGLAPEARYLVDQFDFSADTAQKPFLARRVLFGQVVMEHLMRTKEGGTVKVKTTSAHKEATPIWGNPSAVLHAPLGVPSASSGPPVGTHTPVALVAPVELVAPPAPGVPIPPSVTSIPMFV